MNDKRNTKAVRVDVVTWGKLLLSAPFFPINQIVTDPDRDSCDHQQISPQLGTVEMQSPAPQSRSSRVLLLLREAGVQCAARYPGRYPPVALRPERARPTFSRCLPRPPAISVSALRCLTLTALLAISNTVHAFCVTGVSAEPSLQSVFDGILPAGTINAATDCLSDAEDSYWQQDGGTATTTIVVELAGFASSNVFGIFDIEDSTNVVTVFDGAEGAGDTSEIRFAATADGRYDVFLNQAFNGSFSNDQFGFFLRTPEGNSFFSDTALNGDGTDHMYAYLGSGPGVPFDSSSVLSGRSYSDSFFLLAFEDLDARNPRYDGDFQDFVVGGQFVAPIPLPASFMLLLSSLGLSRLFTHRRRNGRGHSL